MKPQPSTKRRKRRVRDELVYDKIVAMCAADPEQTVRPQDIAAAILPDEWQELLKRIKLYSGKLAKREVIHVIRKGKVADPDDFKGVYKVQAGPNIGDYVPQMPQEPVQEEPINKLEEF